MISVALYVTGHGYGHAVRCAEVARALLERGARVLVRCDAPAWLFPPECELLPASGPIDVGVVQHDGLDLDIDATRRQWADFAERFDAHTDVEAATLRQQRVDVVLGDVPPLAFAAAARAGIPSVAMTNFGWDWIYAAWPCFGSTIELIQRSYSLANLLLRLPLSSTEAGAFPAFGAIADVPLVARHAQRPRSAIRSHLGIGDSETVVLLTFGAFDAQLQLEALAACSEYTFVLTPPIAHRPAAPNVLQLKQQPEDYVSLLAACDVVVTKPGYGIVSDCLANRVPVLFTDRGPFREYDVLADALHTLGPARYVPRHEVLAGQLGPHLAALRALPARWAPLRTDGAQVVAEHLLKWANITV